MHLSSTKISMIGAKNPTSQVCGSDERPVAHSYFSWQRFLFGVLMCRESQIIKSVRTPLIVRFFAWCSIFSSPQSAHHSWMGNTRRAMQTA